MKTETHPELPIVVKDLHKSFGTQNVLEGVGFEVKPGETLAVLGRSGTGKSVLLKLLVGLQQPDSGSIRINGQEIVGLSRIELNGIRKKMGFLFQQAALYDSMTIAENVAFPLARHKRMAGSELRDRVHELLSMVGMENDVDKMPSEISGGMQKRVGLARALALEPDTLLFDEPTAGLDPITASEIVAVIADMRKKRQVTSIVVTHDLHAAKSFSDHFVVLHEGHILSEGTFAELQRSKDKFVKRFLSEAA